MSSYDETKTPKHDRRSGSGRSDDSVTDKHWLLLKSLMLLLWQIYPRWTKVPHPKNENTKMESFPNMGSLTAGPKYMKVCRYALYNRGNSARKLSSCSWAKCLNYSSESTFTEIPPRILLSTLKISISCRTSRTVNLYYRELNKVCTGIMFHEIITCWSVFNVHSFNFQS